MNTLAWIILAVIVLFGVGSLIALWLIRREVRASE